MSAFSFGTKSGTKPGRNQALNRAKSPLFGASHGQVQSRWMLSGVDKSPESLPTSGL